MTVLELGVTAVMAAATAVTARRNPPAAVGITLVGLLLASASVSAVRDVFLTARWGGLVALSLVLLWPLPRPRHELRLELAAVGITAVLTLSALWSIDPQLTVMRAASFGLLLVAVARVASLAVVRSSRLVDVFAALSVAVAVASLLLWWMRPDIAIFVGELRGVLENQNGLGLFFGLTFPFVLAAAERRRPQRVSLVLLTVPFALLLGLTESRTGALAFFTGLVLYEAAGRMPRRLVLQLLVAITAFLTMSLSITNLESGAPAPAVPVPGAPSPTTPAPPVEPPVERPDVLGRGAPAEQGRLAALLGARNEGWSATVDFISDRPVLGYGFGSGDRVFARYPERAKFLYFQGANPNNGYLQAVLELGGVLSLLILLPLALAVVIGLRSAWRRPIGIEHAAFLACLGGALVAGVFESLFTAAGAPWALLAWLSAAVLVRASLAY